MSQSLPIDPSDRYTSIIATAGQTTFAANWPVQRADDFEIWRTRAGARAQVVPVSVQGLGQAGGFSVLMGAGALAGDRYELVGLGRLDRRTSITRGGRYDSAALDADLDRQTMLQQEVRRDLRRMLVAPFGETLAALPARAARAVKSFVFDAAGDPAVDITPSQAEASARAYTDNVVATIVAPIENAQMTAGEALPGFRVVRASPFGLRIANAEDPHHAGSVCGVTIGPYAEGALASFRVRGQITNPAWNFAVGPVYVGPLGAVSSDLPDFGFVQQVGFAVSATTVSIDLQPATQVSGLPDAEEPFAFTPAVAARAVAKATALGILGNNSNETAKFAALSGPIDLCGMVVTVTARPAGVQAKNGYWRIADGEVGQYRLYPVDPYVLPVIRSIMATGQGYTAWTQGTGADGYGDYLRSFYAIASNNHSSSGAGTGACIVLYREKSRGVWTRALRWGPSGDSPGGASCASRYVYRGVEFSCIKKWDAAGATFSYRMQRAHYGRRIEPGGVVTTVAGQSKFFINYENFNPNVYKGLKIVIAAAANVGGLNVNGTYIVDDVSPTRVELVHPGGPFPATETGGGVNLTIRIDETDALDEVLFQTTAGVGRNLGEALIESWPENAAAIAAGGSAMPGSVPPLVNASKPNLIHGLECWRGSTSTAIIGYRKPFGKLAFSRLTKIDRSNPQFAGVAVVLEVAAAAVTHTEPVYRVFEGATPADDILICTARSNGGAAGPAFFAMKADLTEQPFIFDQMPGGVAYDSPVPFVIKPDFDGTGATIIAHMTTNRSPAVGSDGGTWVPHHVLVAKVADALVRGWAAFKVIDALPPLFYQDHTTGVDPGTTASPVGVSTMSDIPGGVAIYTGESGSSAGITGTNTVVTQFKVDTRQFTGEPTTPDMSPEVVENIEADIQHYRNTTGNLVSGTTFRPRGLVNSTFIGQFDINTGFYQSRRDGLYRIWVAVPILCNGALFEMRVLDVETGLPLLEGYSNAASNVLMQLTAPAAGKWMHYGQTLVRLRTNQFIRCGIMSGAVEDLSDGRGELIIERLM